MTPELHELANLRLPYLRADGSYDARILDIAARYAQMAGARRDEVATMSATLRSLAIEDEQILEALIHANDVASDHDGCPIPVAIELLQRRWRG